MRLKWEPRNGLPGLFVRDPITKQRLAAHYEGWFAGVPVRINNLGMRATRDYDLAKAPNTFRILVLGDSITFGHGSVHTYPDLLEQMLRQWRPDVDWQVWNTSVPGYNTSQELAKLLHVGPSYQPDLVIVGFYENDLVGNEPVGPPDRKTIIGSRIRSFVQSNFYSYELYKNIALNIAWKYSHADDYRRRLEHLETEAQLLTSAEQTSDLKAQQLTNYARLTPEQASAQRCIGGETPSEAELAAMQRQPDGNTGLRRCVVFRTCTSAATIASSFSRTSSRRFAQTAISLRRRHRPHQRLLHEDLRRRHAGGEHVRYVSAAPPVGNACRESACDRQREPRESGSAVRISARPDPPSPRAACHKLARFR